MFLPHAIDMLNRRNLIAIQQLEAEATHIKNLEKLCERLGGDLRDVRQIDNNRFAFEITLPATWGTRYIELVHLLWDFDHNKPALDPVTRNLICSSNRGHRLVMVPIHKTAQAAA